MSTFEIQRLNMVELQVRPSDVTDRRILAAMLQLPREAFVPAPQRALAYMDGTIALSAPSPRREVMAPRLLARLIQLAAIEPTDRVLHLAAGTGYATAILSHLATEVIAVESDPALAGLATTALAQAHVANIEMKQGPLPEGWPAEAPYDAIIVEGAVTTVPDGLLDQLKDGGRLIAIRIERTPSGGTVGRAMCWTRSGTHCYARAAFDAAASILPGFETKFEFAL